MDKSIQGKRLYPERDSLERPYAEGGYWKAGHVWYARPPETDMIANLGKHEVVEHEDETITVKPSILVTRGLPGDEWHGFLENGIWRKA